ncbi:MAG: ABC transporter ATP-binding protein [Polyangiales bacterium]
MALSITRTVTLREDDHRPLSLATLRRLYAYTRPHARTRNILIALVLLRAMHLPMLSWAAAAVISGPIAARDIDGVYQGTLGFVALALWAAVTFYYRARNAHELGEAVIHDMRADIMRHVFAMPIGFFQRQRVGSLISRLTSDLEAVRVGVKDVAFVGTVQLGTMLGSAVLMALYDLRLFLVVVALVPVLTWLVRRAQGALLAAHRASHESYSRVAATVAESIAGNRVTQSLGRGAVNSEAFAEQIELHGALNVNSARRAAVLLPTLELNGQIFLATLVALGGYRALHADIEFAVLVQFFFLTALFFNAIPILGTQYNQALTAMSGVERVFDLLDKQPPWRDAADAREIGAIAGHVRFESLSFGYDPKRLVLHGLDLDVLPGQTVALVGHTGSGKSSVLNLVSKFYPATSGRILIDGIDLASVRADSLRRQVGIVTQSNFLFGGTVLDNVRIGRPDASEADILEAARKLDVLDLIEALPRGWRTQLGERGLGLSLGQRQIVCFTRAMLADPRLLLLDEATSAVDVETERRLQRALAHLLAGRTSFIVAHRLSTVRHADLLLVMEDGRIVERGTHDELTSYDSRFLELLNSEGH